MKERQWCFLNDFLIWIKKLSKPSIRISLLKNFCSTRKLAGATNSTQHKSCVSSFVVSMIESNCLKKLYTLSYILFNLIYSSLKMISIEESSRLKPLLWCVILLDDTWRELTESQKRFAQWWKFKTFAVHFLSPWVRDYHFPGRVKPNGLAKQQPPCVK